MNSGHDIGRVSMLMFFPSGSAVKYNALKVVSFYVFSEDMTSLAHQGAFKVETSVYDALCFGGLFENTFLMESLSSSRERCVREVSGGCALDMKES